MTQDLRSHPDYAEGFGDAAQGTPLHYGMSVEYRYGWLALHRARRLLRELQATLAVLGQ